MWWPVFPQWQVNLIIIVTDSGLLVCSAISAQIWDYASLWLVSQSRHVNEDYWVLLRSILMNQEQEASWMESDKGMKPAFSSSRSVSSHVWSSRWLSRTRSASSTTDPITVCNIVLSTRINTSQGKRKKRINVLRLSWRRSVWHMQWVSLQSWLDLQSKGITT